nr:MAG TPA: hypothetical protein [Bacteriophage sp.]
MYTLGLPILAVGEPCPSGLCTRMRTPEKTCLPVSA